MATTPGYQSIQISELPSVPVTDTLVWRPVRRTLGIEAFGMNAYTAANAGDEIVEDHDELGNAAGGHEEVYVVLTGHVTFTVGGEEIDAPAGTLVFLKDPAVRRAAVAKEAGSTVLAVGGEPGKAYEVSAWEYYFAAIPFAKSGEWDKAVGDGRRGARALPGQRVDPLQPRLLRGAGRPARRRGRARAPGALARSAAGRGRDEGLGSRSDPRLALGNPAQLGASSRVRCVR